MDITLGVSSEFLYDTLKAGHLWPCSFNFGGRDSRRALVEYMKLRREELPTMIGMHALVNELIEEAMR